MLVTTNNLDEMANHEGGVPFWTVLLTYLFNYCPIGQGHRHKNSVVKFHQGLKLQSGNNFICTYDRYCFRVLLWTSTMNLIDHEGQGHIFRTVFMMDMHQFRQAVLSGDSSCFKIC